MDGKVVDEQSSFTIEYVGRLYEPLGIAERDIRWEYPDVGFRLVRKIAVELCRRVEHAVERGDGIVVVPGQCKRNVVVGSMAVDLERKGLPVVLYAPDRGLKQEGVEG